MRDDIAEMEHMLNEYLDFAQGEGGEEALNTDLSEIVHDAATAAARRARRGRGSDRASMPIAGTVVAVRRNALKRCATNLIDNALKHGKHVAGRACSTTAASVEILVDDDGPGIPEDRREEAFRPFHRLDEGRNLQTGGSGLGLAIARDIARAHGGEIILTESPAHGLRATIRLPV